jgi:hypothetical protein
MPTLTRVRDSLESQCTKALVHKPFTAPSLAVRKVDFTAGCKTHPFGVSQAAQRNRSSPSLIHPNMKATEHERVRLHTEPQVNENIDEEIALTIADYANAPKSALTQRIEALDREWDIERALQTNASSLALAGVVLGAALDRRWLVLPAGVLTFLLMHATQGWCPPLPLLRRAGVRTRGEIDRERFALKFLRGDFDKVRRGASRGIDIPALVAALER